MDSPRAPFVGQPPRRAGEIEAVVAGFVVWLAGRRLPSGQRRLYHRAVERFLRWEAGHSSIDQPSWGHYAHLRACGAGEAQLRIAREALALLGEYRRGASGCD
jgi:hypothetical protein